MFVTASSIAILCYLATLALLARSFKDIAPLNRAQAAGLSIAGGIAHLCGSLVHMFASTNADFSLFQSGSLIFAVVVLLISASSLKRPLHALLLVIEPIAIGLIIATLLTVPTKTTQLAAGTTVHIVLSILSYGVITIAAASALALYYCDYLLRHRQIGRKLQFLPPMETIDKLLFEMIVAGEVLLTLSILSGFLFVDDFFAQQLAHKTFFSLVSWVIFAWLIIGHYKFGWRGAKAIKWTLSGFTALLLAYVGSKFVIEWVLR